MDMSVAFLSKIERGTSRINLKRLNEICSILNISEGEILEGSTPNSNNYLKKDLSDLLKNCPAEKLSLIYKISKLIIEN